MNGRTEPQTRTSLLYQQARRHHQLGEFGEAVTLYAQVMQARPRHTPTLLYLGEIAWQTGNLDQAIVLLTRAIAVDPQYVAGHDLLWQVYKAQGDTEEAVRVLRRLIEIRRHDGYNYYHLARLQHELGNKAEAQQLFEQAIRYKPDDGRVFAHYGDLLQAMGQIESAATQYRQALVHDPRNAGYHSQFGYLLTLCGQTQEGLTHIDRSVLLDPGNQLLQQQRWQTLLKAGDLPAGFAAAARHGGLGDRTVVNPTYRTIPQWKGESFPGRLLIHAEADIADVLQFARYLPLVKAKVGALILALPKSLQKLFSNLHCVDEIVEATSDGLRVARAEQRLSVTSLPLLFKTTLDTIPTHTPYLFADPFLTHSWVRRLHWQSLRVGLVWSQGAASIESLVSLPGISWYNLQSDSNERNPLSRYELPLVDCSGELRDYADTAALAANLDLIIAVDSPEAHLAAAIGRPVWTLLPFEANWRWLHRREDSPWYPTMRLFRQSQPGDWDTVLQRVADALGPQSRPFRQFQPLQGKPREFFAETAVTY
jgi:Flp pilus assembly protein TadD